MSDTGLVKEWETEYFRVSRLQRSEIDLLRADNAALIGENLALQERLSMAEALLREARESVAVVHSHECYICDQRIARIDAFLSGNTPE